MQINVHIRCNEVVKITKLPTEHNRHLRCRGENESENDDLLGGRRRLRDDRLVQP